MSIGASYWKARFGSWTPAVPAREGYTLLMPVPGDLPVFLEMALETCGAQEHADRVETIVVPDQPTKQVEAVVRRLRPDWSGQLRVQPLPMPERAFLPRLHNPFHNYGVQLIAGVQAAAASHVILHDSDLFHLSRTALDRRFRETREHDLFVSGISPVWDGWFAERDIHIAATWELCARRDWIRSFPPHFHMGHVGELLGEEHVFDITLHAQAVSDPRRIRVFDHDADIVHFNFVIGAYRQFQRSKGPWLDDRFRMILIRLFIDLFAHEPFDYTVPEFDALARGLGDPGQRVTYPEPSDQVQADYADFRRRLTRILEADWMSNPGRRERTTAALATFDRHYGYAG